VNIQIVLGTDSGDHKSIVGLQLVDDQLFLRVDGYQHGTKMSMVMRALGDHEIAAIKDLVYQVEQARIAARGEWEKALIQRWADGENLK
jgi:hypothetical protein